MNVRKTDDFIADVERQYEWYVKKAGLEVMRRAMHGHRDLQRRLLSRGTSLRCVAREIPPVFGSFFPADPKPPRKS